MMRKCYIIMHEGRILHMTFDRKQAKKQLAFHEKSEWYAGSYHQPYLIEREIDDPLFDELTRQLEI